MPISFVCPYAIFSINQLVRVNFQKRVKPLFKQGDRDDVNNYRPISVIPVVVKVIEKIVYENLYAYLEEHDVLNINHSDFRAIHSTVTALLEATDS